MDGRFDGVPPLFSLSPSLSLSLSLSLPLSPSLETLPLSPSSLLLGARLSNSFFS